MGFIEKLNNRIRKQRQIWSLGQGDVLLASYPKCGNTFCRFVFSNILNRKFGLDGEVDFEAIENLTPTLGQKELSSSWKFERFPRVIKTHDMYSPSFDKAEAVVYVMRDPRDMIISYYHWMKSHKRVQYKGTVDEFMWHPEYGIESYIRHISSWKDRAQYIFKYEELMAHGFDLFQAFFNAWPGLDVSNSIIQESVEESLPEKAKVIESKSGNKIGKKLLGSDFKHVRSGKVGQWKEVFDKNTLKQLKERHQSFFVNIGYDLSY